MNRETSHKHKHVVKTDTVQRYKKMKEEEKLKRDFKTKHLS